MGTQRARRTLVVADVVESVRIMLTHEDDVIERWLRFVHLVRSEVLPQHGGRMVKSLGDGMLLTFESTPAAVACAMELQRRLAPFNEGCPEEACMHLRVGAHVADVVVDALDVFGSGVNLTARLAALAGPGEIVVSAEVRDSLIPQVDATFQDMGECYMKHIDQPLRTFRVVPAGPALALPSALPPQRAMVPRIAVLPLRNASDEARLVRVGESVCDDLISHMSRCAYWQITSRLSTSVIAARDLDLTSLGGLLKVDYVMSGDVNLYGPHATVRLEMAEARGGTVIWSETFNTHVDQIMVGEGAVARRANAHIMRAVLRREMELSHVAAMPNLPSYALLLQSITLLHSLAPTHFERARETLTFLGDRHPRSPDVLAWTAQWHVFRIFQKWSRDAARDADAARRCLDKAVDIDDRHALTQTLMGHAAAAVGCDPVRAEVHLRLALATNPNEPMAWLFLSHVLSCQDRHDEGVQALEQARALSPLDPMAYFYDVYAASVYGAASQHIEALRCAHRAVSTNAYHLPSLAVLIIAQHDAGMMAEARQTAERYLGLRPDASVRRFLAHHTAGDRPIAHREAKALLAAGIPL